MHTTCKLLHGISVGHACRGRIVLSLAEATIIGADDNLDLLPALSVGAEDVKVGIAGNAIEGRLKLFAVADGTAGTEIKWNRPRNREAAADSRVNRSTHRRSPAAARKPHHVEGAIVGKM